MKKWPQMTVLTFLATVAILDCRLAQGEETQQEDISVPLPAAPMQKEYVVGKNIFIEDSGRCLDAEGKAIEDDIAVSVIEGSVVLFQGGCSMGMLEGTGREYDDFGKLRREETYKNGKREGMGKVYRDDGKPLATIVYKKDRAVSGTCHHTNGKNIPLSKAEIAEWNNESEISCQ